MKRLLSLLCFVSLIAAATAVSAQLTVPAAPTAGPTTEQRRAVAQNAFHQTLRFEPNQGQAAKGVQFVSRGQGYALLLTPADAVLALDGKDGRQASVEMMEVGGNRKATVTGAEPLSSHSNYLIGSDPAGWHSNVPNFGRVRYTGIYPGIDLTYYGNQSRLEYDFVVAPGANPDAIRLAFKGMEHLRLEQNGSLAIETTGGTLHMERPVVYQQNASGQRSVVEGSFTVARNEVSFKLGAYDRSRPLVIDPVVAYSSFLSAQTPFFPSLGARAQDNNYASSIAIDDKGDVYVSGTTGSGFPVVVDSGRRRPGPTDPIQDPTAQASQSITADAINPGAPVNPNALYTFISKFNASGTELIYSTYIGGLGGPNFGKGVAIDSAGAAYIAGLTFARDFPVTKNAFITKATARDFDLGGTGMGFVAKLNPTGSKLEYATYMGGTVKSTVYGIAVDSTGHAYVTGSDQGGLPTTQQAFQRSIPGFESPFVAKLAVDGRSLVYGTYVGGEYDDEAFAIALDSEGNAYITGETFSAQFPTTAPHGFVPYQAGNENIGFSQDGTSAFVSKLNASGSGLIYSTYLGPVIVDSSFAEGFGIAVDPMGNAYVTGATSSIYFPTTPGAFQSTNPNVVDLNQLTVAFVSKVNTTGSDLVYSTYLGENNIATAIAVDTTGEVWVTGGTNSAAPTRTLPGFPLLHPLPGFSTNGNEEAFVTEFNPLGQPVYSTTFGGGGGTVYGTAIAVNPQTRDVFFTGGTGANDTPVTPGAYQTTFPDGDSSYFVTKLWPLSIAPDMTNLQFPQTPVGSSSTLPPVTLTNTGLTSFTFSAMTMGGADARQFSEVNSCGAALAPGHSCVITLEFTPPSTTSYSGNLSFNITDSTGVTRTMVANLTGTGTGSAIAQLSPTLVTLDNAEQTKDIILSNSGNLPLLISGITITGPQATFFQEANNCGTSLGANSSCTIGVRYRPISSPSVNPSAQSFAYATAFVNVADNAANSSTQTAEITGPAPAVSLSPGEFTFPDTLVGTAAAVVPVTLTNSGSAPLSISSITLGGANKKQFAESTNCGATLAAHASCTISIGFVPGTAALFTGTVTVVDNAVVGTSILTFTGMGTAPQLKLTNSAMTFPNTAVGDTAPTQQMVLSNPGSAPLLISSITIGNAGGAAGLLDRRTYGLSTNCGASVMPGQSCVLNITYHPVEAGTLSAPLLIVANVSGGPQFGTLTGFSDVPEAVLSATSLAFPKTIDGLSDTMAFKITESRNVPLTFSGFGFNGPSGAFSTIGNDCPNVLAANASCTITVKFAPTTVGNLAATYLLTYNGNPGSQQVKLTGTGSPAAPVAVLSVHAITFADTVTAHVSPIQSFTLTNEGSAPLTGIVMKLSTNGVFGISNSTCGTSLAVQQSCTVSMIFAPPLAKNYAAALNITDSAAGSPQTVALSGIGENPDVEATLVAEGGTSAAQFNFRSAAVGTTSQGPRTALLTNTGNMPLFISDVLIVANGYGSVKSFLMTNGCGATLAPGASCSISITFEPFVAGANAAELVVYDNAKSVAQSIELFGTGT